MISFVGDESDKNTMIVVVNVLTVIVSIVKAIFYCQKAKKIKGLKLVVTLLGTAGPCIAIFVDVVYDSQETVLWLTVIGTFVSFFCGNIDLFDLEVNYNKKQVDEFCASIEMTKRNAQWILNNIMNYNKYNGTKLRNYERDVLKVFLQDPDLPMRMAEANDAYDPFPKKPPWNKLFVLLCCIVLRPLSFLQQQLVYNVWAVYACL